MACKVFEHCKQCGKFQSYIWHGQHEVCHRCKSDRKAKAKWENFVAEVDHELKSTQDR